MTRRAGVALALALALAMAGPAGASGASKRRACFPKGSSTVVKTSAARVFQAGDGVYGCLFSVGRRRLLDNEDGLYTTVGPVRIAGRFAAWGFTEIPACKADCPPGTTGTRTVGVVDLRSGRRRVTGGAPDALLLTRFGAAAWIEGTGAGAVVVAWESGGRRELDRGSIARSPFRLYGSSVLWRKDGVGRWEELRR